MRKQTHRGVSITVGSELRSGPHSALLGGLQGYLHHIAEFLPTPHTAGLLQPVWGILGVTGKIWSSLLHPRAWWDSEFSPDDRRVQSPPPHRPASSQNQRFIQTRERHCFSLQNGIPPFSFFFFFKLISKHRITTGLGAR